jgi:peptidoglycan hydrolase CwlO-like protein
MIEIEGLEELQEMLQAGSEELADMQRKIDELDAQITATRNQIGEQDRLIAQHARSLEERKARLVLCQVTQPLRHNFGNKREG